MSRISQPVGQVRFTNVAVVRLKKGGKRYEIAAYRNKVLAWRNGTEKDIYEVLQTTNVFTNVSKGILAKGKELLEAFGIEDHVKVAQLILDKGEVEVTDKERGAIQENLTKDVATIVADKCVNPTTKRPYPVSIIITALKDTHFSVNLAKSAKQQALKAVETLAAHIPIERAKMRIRINVPLSDAAAVQTQLLEALNADLEPGDKAAVPADIATFEAVIDPGVYRAIEEIIAKRTDGKSSVEVLTLSAAVDPDLDGSRRDTRGGAGVESDDSDAEPSSVSDSKRAPAAAAIGRAARPEASTTASARGTGMMVTRVTLPGRSLSCNTCGSTFEKPEDHRAHFRTDHHRYNLKTKAKGVAGISLEEYEALTPAARSEVLDFIE